jgi:hypothetical protein
MVWRWTEQSGFLDLGNLGNDEELFVNGMNSDGSKIVGYSGTDPNATWPSLEIAKPAPFVWTRETGMEPLPGWSSSLYIHGSANAVTDDGSVIVGYMSSSESWGPRYAFVWDESTGIRDLQNVLASDHGLAASLDGWILQEATAVSEDGLRIVGYGLNPNGNTEAWITIFDPPLQAGDADQDFVFDQLDLVKVQVSAKYLTGEPATWGDGDWNGAPGGFRGNTPVGDGVFNQLDIVAAQQAGLYLSGQYNAIRRDGYPGDDQTTIIYNPLTGELAVDAPAGKELTSINIDSAAGIFTGDPAENLGGSFDNDSDGNIFKATFGDSFGSLSFGNVAQTGLPWGVVANDLTVVGSLAGGGDLGDVDLFDIPEPSTALLLVLGVLFCVRRRLR